MCTDCYSRKEVRENNDERKLEVVAKERKTMSKDQYTYTDIHISTS